MDLGLSTATGFRRDIEYVQAARALQAGGEEAQAITVYKDAIAVSPGDVGTQGDAWRFMASLTIRWARM
jgi:hypothetical protein